jgi:hypothetical protein
MRTSPSDPEWLSRKNHWHHGSPTITIWSEPQWATHQCGDCGANWRYIPAYIVPTTPPTHFGGSWSVRSYSMGAVLRRCDAEHDSPDTHRRHRARSTMNQIIESTTTTKLGSTELTQIHLTPEGEELLTTRRIAAALTSPTISDAIVNTGCMNLLLVKKRSVLPRASARCHPKDGNATCQRITRDHAQRGRMRGGCV